MPLNLMILTSYFAIEPKSIRGGISYRYVGLYGSLVKALMNCSPESRIFWYSHSDRCLRLITRKKTIEKQFGILKAVLGAIFCTLRNRSYLAVVVAYPYAVPRVQAVLGYILSLLVLKVFGIGGRVKVIVDIFDPPVEAAYAFQEKGPSIPAILYYRILDMLSLKLASFIIVPSQSYRQYVTKVYRINRLKISVVPTGSLVRYISFAPTKSEGPLTVLYSGSAMKVKDVDKLVSIITNLRECGLEIKLYIAGAKLMDLPDYVHIGSYGWVSFVKDILSNSDIGVIPYPPNRLHFSYTMLSKLFDYMAAGKPIISTALKETGNIIRMFNCGLVARNWKEFKLHLKKLYRNREFAQKLGENGRRAAEKYFDYELLARTLLTKLIKMFEIDH